MRLRERFERYLRIYGLEIMCATMYISGNINVDLIQEYCDR